MKRPLILIAGALLVAFAAAYFGSPYLAARNLREAARSVDADAIEAGVDFPAVRDSLKSQFNAAIARKMAEDPDMKSNPFAGLGMMMAPAIVDRMVDSFVTPDGIAAFARGQKPNAPKTEANNDVEYSYSWVNLDRFRIHLRNAAQAKDGPSLLFERRGLFTWKLIRIEIADLLDDAPKGSTAVASPAAPLDALPTPASSPPATGKLSTTIDPASSDDDLKDQWDALNEECRGGPHTPDDEVCTARDRANSALESRGWCWAYSDVSVVAADYRWHRCDVARP